MNNYKAMHQKAKVSYKQSLHYLQRTINCLELQKLFAHRICFSGLNRLCRLWPVSETHANVSDLKCAQCRHPSARDPLSSGPHCSPGRP